MPPLDLLAVQQQLDDQRRKVDVDHYDLTVREIVRMTTEGELRRAPEYQRRFRWSDYDESRLIESLFLGLPVPSIFVATNHDGTWELVDGLQRVSTLIHFTADTAAISVLGKHGALTLQGLEKLEALNHLTYADLPTTLQISFSRRSLRVTALSDKSDPDVRFDMFDRLNRGGIALTPQEVRACVFRGSFSEFLRTLSDDPGFLRLVKLQQLKKNDGTREELVLKFFAYLYARDEFKGEVTAFLNNYMKRAANSFDYETSRQLFVDVVRCLLRATGDRPLLRDRVNVTPQNQLEACMVGVAEILRSGQIPGTPAGDWTNDPELVQHSTKGTNTAPALQARIHRVTELFQPTPSPVAISTA